MQAVIMAGGKGTRLASVTKDEIPKPMVPIAGKPLLLWQIEECRRNGIRDVIFITGHLGEQIEAFFRDGSSYGMHISYIREQTPLGTAGSFYALKRLLTEPYFLLCPHHLLVSISKAFKAQFFQPAHHIIFRTVHIRTSHSQPLLQIRFRYQRRNVTFAPAKSASFMGTKGNDRFSRQIIGL